MNLNNALLIELELIICRNICLGWRETHYVYRTEYVPLWWNVRLKADTHMRTEIFPWMCMWYCSLCHAVCYSSSLFFCLSISFSKFSSYTYWGHLSVVIWCDMRKICSILHIDIISDNILTKSSATTESK